MSERTDISSEAPEVNLDNKKARAFLLGNLSFAEAAGYLEQIQKSDCWQIQLAVFRDDLVLDYLKDNLSAPDYISFIHYFLTDSSNRELLNFMRSTLEMIRLDNPG